LNTFHHVFFQIDSSLSIINVKVDRSILMYLYIFKRLVFFKLLFFIFIEFNARHGPKDHLLVKHRVKDFSKKLNILFINIIYYIDANISCALKEPRRYVNALARRLVSDFLNHMPIRCKRLDMSRYFAFVQSIFFRPCEFFA
jgi:hypothetical protein